MNNRETITLDKEIARDMCYSDAPDEFRIIENEIMGNGRWSIHSRLVIQRVSDGKFFAADYSKGATEGQDEQPFQYDDAEFTEVFPIQKTITVYE